MFLSTLLNLTPYSMCVILMAGAIALYNVQKEDQKAQVLNWVRYCLGLVFVLGLALCAVGCDKADPKPTLPPTPTVQHVPASAAVASIAGSQLTVVVEVPKGGRVGEVEVQFNKPIYEGSMSDACAGWYRAQDMWGLTWAVKVEGNALILSPADHKHDLVQGTWTVHISWYRGTELPQLHSVEVK